MACSYPHSKQKKDTELKPRHSYSATPAHPTEWQWGTQLGGGAQIWVLRPFWSSFGPCWPPTLSFVVGFPRLRVSGGGNEDLLPFCVNPAKGTDCIEAERVLSRASCILCLGRNTVKGSKPTRTLAIRLHRRQTHLTTNGKSKSSLYPVEFWNSINFFPIFQNLQNEQLWIWNWHLPNNMIFVLPNMLVWWFILFFSFRLAKLS